MRTALRHAEAVETLRVAQHLTPLLGQRDALTGDLLLPRHTDREDLLGFLPRRHTAAGRQTKRDASRILCLAHPVWLGYPEKRFDRIGADRQADMAQTEGLSCLKLDLEIGAKLQAQCRGGYRVKQRLAWGQGVVREPLRFEHLLARQQACGIGSKPRDEGFARGQLIQASPQPG